MKTRQSPILARMAVLVDRFSASASEIFSGAIQDYGRGMISVPKLTVKVSVQSAIDLDKVISPTIRDKLASLTGKGSTKQVSTGSQSTLAS